jgi:signal transduction histidine kinase
MTINKTRIILENSLQISNISEDDQLTLYRIFQEATRNAILHGNAKNIIITLYKSADYDFIFEIQDDGNGFETNENKSDVESKKTNSQGLNNMRRRTSMINGEFHLQSTINHGTKITIKKQHSINDFVSHPIHD